MYFFLKLYKLSGIGFFVFFFKDTWFFISLGSADDNTTKSLEAVTKPPIYSQLTATLEGLLPIRSYHAKKRFDSMDLEKLDTNH